MTVRTPQRGQPVTAEWARAVVAAINANRVTAGEGLRETGGPNGKVLSLAPVRRAVTQGAAPAAGYPRPFDIGVADGMARVSNAIFQLGDVVLGSAGGPREIELPGSASTLYALLTVVNSGGAPVMTDWQLSYSPGPAGGGAFPLALYRLSAAGEVLVDLRGSAVVMYK